MVGVGGGDASRLAGFGACRLASLEFAAGMVVVVYWGVDIVFFELELTVSRIVLPSRGVGVCGSLAEGRPDVYKLCHVP